MVGANDRIRRGRPFYRTAGLETTNVASRSPAHRQVLVALVTYLSNQDDRLAYDRFRKMGLDIGSGAVEAACKHVVGVRVKRNGMCWFQAGVQATLSLQVVHLNDLWEAFWAQKPLRKAA